MADTIELDKLKVPELRKLCKEKSLPSTGNKSELLQRLHEALDGTDDAEGDQVETISDGEDELDDDLNDDEDGDDAPEDGDEAVDDDILNVSNEDEEKLEEKTEEPTTPEPANKVTKITPPKPDKPEAPTQIKTSMSAQEQKHVLMRLALRAQRFGVDSGQSKKVASSERASGTSEADDAKKLARAQRFGLPVAPAKTAGGGSAASIKAASNAPQTTEDLEKLKRRAERFGSVTSKTLSKTDEDERLLKRKQRFGAVTSTTAGSATVKSATNSDIEDAKRRRAERFGLNK